MQKNAYYAYSQIHYGALRTLFRVLLFLRPVTVAVYGDDDIQRAVSLALPASKAEFADSAAITVLDAARHPEVYLRPGCDAIVLNPSASTAWKELCAGMNAGMTFDAGGIAVAVASRPLPRQHFML